MISSVFSSRRRDKSSSMGVHPESGSSNVPVVERDPMKLWKGMKQHGRNLDAVNTDASRSDSYPRIFKYSMPDCNYSMHYYDENNRVCSDGEFSDENNTFVSRFQAADYFSENASSSSRRMHQIFTVLVFSLLKFPMRSSELSALFCGIDNAFQVYTSHVIEELVQLARMIWFHLNLSLLVTRRIQQSGFFIARKELLESKQPDERRSINNAVPATTKLCVQLNTLHGWVASCTILDGGPSRVFEAVRRRCRGL
ncbi:unnamed protein product [Arabidopsis arenosa]|uniref:Uncharacterized protein n=1 Tax=Arabidopsis arenosa TaxID=38785 RepID=A0A8S2AJT0_ARAAE|nr:unnamed protein product [Arabidopsis arenosa]